VTVRRRRRIGVGTGGYNGIAQTKTLPQDNRPVRIGIRIRIVAASLLGLLLEAAAPAAASPRKTSEQINKRFPVPFMVLSYTFP